MLYGFGGGTGGVSPPEPVFGVLVGGVGVVGVLVGSVIIILF